MARLAAIILWGAPGLPAQPGADMGRIEGTLVNVLTGQPLRKGTLRFDPAMGTPGESQRTLSGTGGAFAFEAIPPGRYILTAEMRGYALATYRRGGSRILAIEAGKTLEDVGVGLTPYGVVAGRVLIQMTASSCETV